MPIFSIFFLALIEIWRQNQIEHIILGIIPAFYALILHILENKNIISSGFYLYFSIYFRFFGHFRLPEVIETPIKPQFQPSSMLWKNFWVDILSGPWLSAPICLLEKKVVNIKYM